MTTLTVSSAARKVRMSQHRFERILDRYGVAIVWRGRWRWVAWADVSAALARDAAAETVVQAAARLGVPVYILWAALRAAGHTTVPRRAYRLPPAAYDAALRAL
jgi:sugar phosphate isomerase/epimerase